MFNWIKAAINNEVVYNTVMAFACVAYCLTLFIEFRAMAEFGVTASISLIGLAIVVSEAVMIDWIRSL